jgi:hypothetical protein
VHLSNYIPLLMLNSRILIAALSQSYRFRRPYLLLNALGVSMRVLLILLPLISLLLVMLLILLLVILLVLLMMLLVLLMVLLVVLLLLLVGSKPL